LVVVEGINGFGGFTESSGGDIISSIFWDDVGGILSNTLWDECGWSNSLGLFIKALGHASSIVGIWPGTAASLYTVFSWALSIQEASIILWFIGFNPFTISVHDIPSILIVESWRDE